MRVTVSSEQIESAFEAVKDDPSFDESRGLWERGHAPVEMLQAMCLRPEILRAFAGFGGSVYPGGLLERRIKELVIITASAANDCQFCTNAHVDIVDIWRIVETPLAIIDEPAALPPRERLGAEPAVFPGDHGGFMGGEYGQPPGEPDAFAAKLREVLAAG